MATRSQVRSQVTIQDLIPSFQRTLLAENKSPQTVKSYLEAVQLFSNFLVKQGMPLAMFHIRREHVETFIADQLQRWKPATANNRGASSSFSSGA